MVTIELSRLQARRLLVVLKTVRDEFEQGELILALACRDQPHTRMGLHSVHHNYKETRVSREALDELINQLEEPKEE